MKKALVIVFGVLFLDQFIKIWIKTHLYLGEAYRVVGSWFYLHFVENPGMAFGLTLGDGGGGKLLLSVFRLLAVAGIGYYLWTLFKKKVRPLLIVCVALIFAGAMGNILDSVFYGKLFSTSDAWDENVAKFMPKEGGYAPFLHGQVVDMFYFPVYHGHFPSWFPKAMEDYADPSQDHMPSWVPRRNESFTFFSPVFNIADASISMGVFLLIVFQRRLFGKPFNLSDRKIFTTNIFFGILVFLISTFLLLTLFTLFSTVHPLSGLKLGIVFALSAGCGFQFFRILQQLPRFAAPAEETPAAGLEEEKKDVASAPAESPDEQQS